MFILSFERLFSENSDDINFTTFQHEKGEFSIFDSEKIYFIGNNPHHVSFEERKEDFREFEKMTIPIKII